MLPPRLKCICVSVRLQKKNHLKLSFNSWIIFLLLFLNYYTHRCCAMCICTLSFLQKPNRCLFFPILNIALYITCMRIQQQLTFLLYYIFLLLSLTTCCCCCFHALLALDPQYVFISLTMLRCRIFWKKGECLKFHLRSLEG